MCCEENPCRLTTRSSGRPNSNAMFGGIAPPLNASVRRPDKRTTHTMVLTKSRVSLRSATVATAALLLGACVTIDDTFNQTAMMAERSCAQKGKRPIFTQSEVNSDFWHGDSVALHSICVAPGDPRYEHPGLQILMNDSVNPKGASVALVIRGFAGANIGLKRGDVITAIDDHPIAGRDDTGKYTFVKTPTDVRITYVRDQRSTTVIAHL